MKATVLVDNNTRDLLKAEWGLSIYIEHEGKKILLDCGTTNMFAENAEALGIDLSTVNLGVLSHAHFDHSDGLDGFFEKNPEAKFYLRSACRENCYSRKGGTELHYIGIKEGYLEQYSDRLQYVDGDLEVAPGVWLIPHKSSNLDAVGEHAGMYVKIRGRFEPDAFEHEQSLVLETAKGLVVFNSCSHGGADRIIYDICKTWPDKKILAYIGGLHLFRSSDQEVLEFARRVKETGIGRIYTGHCTGDRAMELLKQELGDVVQEIYTGLEIQL